jgi:hypothetical protein
MFRTISLTSTLSLATLGALVAMASAQDPQPPDVLVDAPPVRVVAAAPTYWLGVECEPVDAPLRAQLKLEDRQGLLVRYVMPDSPAAKAGLQANDVLLKFNDAKLGEVADLSRAVADAKDKESTVQIIREGESQKLEITPQKRPDVAQARPRDVRATAKLRNWLPFEPGDEPFRMLFVRPGMVGPFGFTAPELPNDSSLTIAREGDEPAKIVYRQGDKTWEAAADKIDDLPEEIRPFVRRALGGDGWQVRSLDGAIFPKEFPAPGVAPPGADIRVERLRLFREQQKENAEAKEAAPDAPQPEATDSAESAVGELRRAVQELRQEVQKLRQERAADREQ